jgi:hypothetical protein
MGKDMTGNSFDPNWRMPTKEGDKVFSDTKDHLVLGKNPDRTEVSLVSGGDLMNRSYAELNRTDMPTEVRDELKWAKYYDGHPDKVPFFGDTFHAIGAPPDETSADAPGGAKGVGKNAPTSDVSAAPLPHHAHHRDHAKLNHHHPHDAHVAAGAGHGKDTVIAAKTRGFKPAV